MSVPHDSEKVEHPKKEEEDAEEENETKDNERLSSAEQRDVQDPPHDKQKAKKKDKDRDDVEELDVNAKDEKDEEKEEEEDGGAENAGVEEDIEYVFKLSDWVQVTEEVDSWREIPLALDIADAILPGMYHKLHPI